MRTCAQNDVPPLPYLTDVLRKLAEGWDPSRLEELLPDRWQQLHSGGGANGLWPPADLHKVFTASI